MIHPTRVLLALLLATAIPAQGKNLLFYGNSYSFFAWGYGVPELVQQIAIAAGHPRPTIVAALVGGSNLQYHATDPNQVAAIGNTLPPGQHWDHVILQEHSLGATYLYGNNPLSFRSSAVAIMTNVRSHSPAARGVLYQTWARARGHDYYPGVWPNPMAMHNLVRNNYRLALSDIESAFGAGSAVLSAVGDGMALCEWDPALYDPDLSHPGPAMTLLAAMCIYTSIYGQTLCAIQPAFTPPGPLATMLATQRLGAADWHAMAGIADACADRTLRPFPGSGDHLLLEAGTPPGPVSPCHHHRITTGSSLSIRIRSLNGVYDNAWSWMLVDLFPTGAPPSPWALYPEVAVNVGTMSPLLTSTTLTVPLSLSTPVPFSWPGTSVMVQGVAWAASSQTGNPWFTTTDAHEFVFH